MTCIYIKNIFYFSLANLAYNASTAQNIHLPKAYYNIINVQFTRFIESSARRYGFGRLCIPRAVSSVKICHTVENIDNFADFNPATIIAR